ncbi:MAG: type II secretion system protein GspG [Candidatus Kappaea frigidicola]|nr:type II secretion system protein GspG [Candidatus Kappaea frigidicola]
MRHVSKKSFTLVEMITVLVMIGVLLGLILTGSFNAIKEAKIEKAKAALKATKAALSMFEADVGDYPVYTETAANGNEFRSWLENGDYCAGSFDYDNWFGPYMNFIDAEILNNTHYLDPWGNGYRYYSADGTSYNLWSWGPDGENDSGDGSSISPDDIGG